MKTIQNLFKKSITVAVATFVALATPQSSPSAFAGQDELIRFFTAFEGSWDGSGMESELNAQGVWTVSPYDIEVRVNDRMNPEWDFHQEIRMRSGITKFNDIQFRVAGDYLFLTSVGPLDPVNVIESTPRKLVYSFRRHEVLTGRVYDFKHSLEFKAPNKIVGATEVQLNGVKIAADNFQLKR